MDLCTNDAGDEQSSGSDGMNPPWRRSPDEKRFHKLLDYRGPRVIAIEGSTIKWRGKSGKSRKKSTNLFFTDKLVCGMPRLVFCYPMYDCCII